jgi:hypothetical protein
MGKHGLEQRNGERFLDRCSPNQMVIRGNIFPHEHIHKATWRSLDHISKSDIPYVHRWEIQMIMLGCTGDARCVCIIGSSSAGDDIGTSRLTPIWAQDIMLGYWIPETSSTHSTLFWKKTRYHILEDTIEDEVPLLKSNGKLPKKPGKTYVRRREGLQQLPWDLATIYLG